MLVAGKNRGTGDHARRHDVRARRRRRREQQGQADQQAGEGGDVGFDRLHYLGPDWGGSCRVSISGPFEENRPSDDVEGVTELSIFGR